MDTKINMRTLDFTSDFRALFIFVEVFIIINMCLLMVE